MRNKAQRPRLRRPKGTGCLFFLEAKGLYVYEQELPKGADGKRRKRRVYGRTEQECKRRIADLKAMGGGTLRPAQVTRLADYATHWLAQTEKRVAPKTIESYRWAWEHACGGVGGIRLDRFDRSAVLSLFADLKAAGKSPNTILHVSRVLKTILGDAISDGKYGGTNPLLLVRRQMPKHSAAKGRALSVAECRRFIAAAREDRLEAAWILGLTAGLRIGEMFGLQWDDIDFKQRTVYVQRQAQDTAKLIISDLKTEDSLRLLPLGALAVQALERRRAAISKREKDSPWVFPSTNPLNPVSPHNARARSFSAIVKAAGIEGKLSPHDLRHSMNSLADAAGVTEKVRSERMGHSDSAITRSVYTHSIDGQAREAAAKIDAFLKAKPG